MADRWATFDCYGTLIDWEKGITDAFTAVLPVPGDPLRNNDERELITHPSVWSRASGNTRSRKACRTVSIEAGREGTA